MLFNKKQGGSEERVQAASFFFKSVLLVTVVVIIMQLIRKSVPESSLNKKSWMAASLDKESRLKNITSPKIVFIGGSNLAFGLDSRKIETAIGMPVVNMGLHAGMGFQFMLEESKADIHAGDIVILSFEYQLKEIAGGGLCANLIAVNPAAAPYCLNSTKQYVSFFAADFQRGLAYWFNRYFGSPVTIEDIRDNVTEEGDFTFHLKRAHVPKLMGSEKWNSEDCTRIILKINEFVAYVAGRKATVYFSFPALALSQYNLNQEVVKAIAARYEKELNCKTLNRAQGLILNDSLFYNSVYHLNGAGRQIRTDTIIRALQHREIHGCGGW
jgi:hypothetical protein